MVTTVYWKRIMGRYWVGLILDTVSFTILCVTLLCIQGSSIKRYHTFGYLDKMSVTKFFFQFVCFFVCLLKFLKVISFHFWLCRLAHLMQNNNSTDNHDDSKVALIIITCFISSAHRSILKGTWIDLCKKWWMAILLHNRLIATV